MYVKLHIVEFFSGLIIILNPHRASAATADWVPLKYIVTMYVNTSGSSTVDADTRCGYALNKIRIVTEKTFFQHLGSMTLHTLQEVQ